MKPTACSGSSRTISNLKDVVSRRESHEGTPDRNNHMGACALLLLSPGNVKDRVGGFWELKHTNSDFPHLTSEKDT